MITQIISAFFGTVATAILNNSPKKYLISAGIIGTIGFYIYLLLVEKGQNKINATFFAAFLVALCSHILARIYKAPVTTFLLSGIIPLVPGRGMYEIVYAVLYNQVSDAQFYFFQTIQIAGMIAMAIFIVDFLFSKNITISKSLSKKKRKIRK